MRVGAAGAALIVLLLAPAGCASPDTERTSPVASAAPATPRPSCSAPGAPTVAQPVDGGTPPPPPARIELSAGTFPGQVRVRVVAGPGVEYDASQVRFSVNGCAVPYTDEGDELPERVLSGLHPGDRVQVLARLNGEGGDSAETASGVWTQP